MRNIRQNLFFAFVYNALGVPIAAGVLYPVLRAAAQPDDRRAAMSFSSVSVIANALRLRRADDSDERAARPTRRAATSTGRCIVDSARAAPDGARRPACCSSGFTWGPSGWPTPSPTSSTSLGRLWFWMVPLVLGFSLQVGLFVYARRAARARHATAHAHGVVASGGASTVSMVACCAHHLTEVLPVLGFAGAATVLATYQSVFLLAGVLANLGGLVYVLGCCGGAACFQLEHPYCLLPCGHGARSKELAMNVRRETNALWRVTASALAILAVVSCSGSNSAAAADGKILGVTKESAGAATVALTPKKFADGQLLVDMQATTHTLNDLDKYDLTKIVSLEFDGQKVAPALAPKLAVGHHSSGQLTFPVKALPKSFAIETVPRARPAGRAGAVVALMRLETM